MNQQVDSKKVQALREAVRLANDLYRKGNHPLIQEWRTGERILKEYKITPDSLDPEKLLDACVILDSLWNTRIYPGDVAEWAKKLTKFLDKDWKELNVDPTGKRNLVARELMLERIDEKEKEKRKKELPSQRIPKCFLSKFFHLLVKGGDEDFPLYDSFAWEAAKRIVNSIPEFKDLSKRKRRGDYEWHAEKVLAICKQLSSDDKPVGFRKLDRLLWIAGHYWDEKCKEAWREMFKEQELKELRECLNKFKMPGWMNG